MKVETGTSRMVETETRIEAPIEQVWRALTDPVELPRWFPLEARVAPGAGGEILLSWGERERNVCRIRIWDPPRHLQTGWFEPADPAVAATSARRMLCVDYQLEGRGGSTTLRLVHSGFGPEARWDNEYDGVRRGWNFELRSLRHYLEHHAGKDRRVAWARRKIDRPAEDVWNRLWSERGLLAGGSMPGAARERYALTTATGQRLEGRVLVLGPPRDFGGTVGNLHDALFRVGLDDCFEGGPEVFLWLSSWDLPATELQAIERRWADLLAECV